jgi:hypothetical protein
MERLALDAGAEIAAATFDGPPFFIVVESGRLSKRRVVDFAGHEGAGVLDSGVAVPLPPGRHAVCARQYRGRSIVPSPALADYAPHPFTLVVEEALTAHKLRLSDLEAVCLRTQLQRIRTSLRTEPDDEQLIRIWVEQKQAMEWEAMKQKSLRTAISKTSSAMKMSTMELPTPIGHTAVRGLLDEFPPV